MPVMGRTKKEVLSEFRTTEILEAARRMFALRGFHESTVDEIAETAGVAKGTVYIYYRSKRELYWAALKHGIAALYEELKAQLQKAETTEEKVRAFIATKIIFYDTNRDFFKIFFSEFGNALAHPVDIHKDFKEMYSRQARLLEDVLDEGVRRKSVRRIRAKPAAYAISEITRGAITQRLLGWSKGDVEEETDFIFDLVWKGIENR